MKERFITEPIIKERMQGIWERVSKKEALSLAGELLCEPMKGVVLLKLGISAACGLAMALTPIAVAATDLLRLP